jgi:hypothetical protein
MQMHFMHLLVFQPLFLNSLSIKEAEMLNEAEFIIRTGNNQMYVIAPGISEKRLWVRSINEAIKKYHQVQQQFLQKQRSSESPQFWNPGTIQIFRIQSQDWQFRF